MDWSLYIVQTWSLLRFDMPLPRFDLPIVRFDLPLMLFDLTLLRFDLPILGFDLLLLLFDLLFPGPAWSRCIWGRVPSALKLSYQEIQHQFHVRDNVKMANSTPLTPTTAPGIFSFRVFPLSFPSPPSFICYLSEF